MQFPVKPGASAAKNLVNRSKVVARRTTAHSAHHAVHTNVKVLSLNPHGPPAWWVDNKKAACEEKILAVPATDPK
jgi:tRNA G26 N,N-dimethylase Trm1